MYKQQKRNESGFAHLAIFLCILILAAIGAIGWLVYSKQQQQDPKQNSSATNDTASINQVTWAYTNDAWKPSSTPPECPSPLLETPVDLSSATAILYPGQTRGIYKAHGGVIFRNNFDNNVDVKVAIDSKLVRVARYIQTNQVQYMVDFVSPCGVAIRYDHLHTLTPEFMDIMNKLPVPRVNDSTTTDIDGETYKAGTKIATKIGFLAPDQNTTLDFGVYDYRKPNEASKNPVYASAHKTGGHTDFYAACWLNDLPEKDKILALSLPGGDGKAGKTSDYCK